MLDTRTDVVDTRFPTGWSFVPEPVLSGRPVPGTFIVEIAVDAGGFRIDDRLTPPSVVAQAVAAARSAAGETPEDDPVLVVPHGLIPAGAAADLLFGALAEALGVAVTAADGPVGPTADGLTTAGEFRRWAPTGGSEPLGPMIAVEPVAVEPVAVEPVAVEPVAVEPVTEPVAVEPVAVEPVTEPVAVEPVAVEPVAVEPVTETIAAVPVTETIAAVPLRPADPAPRALPARGRAAVILAARADHEPTPAKLNGVHAHALDAARWTRPWTGVETPAPPVPDTEPAVIEPVQVENGGPEETDPAPDPSPPETSQRPVWIAGAPWRAEERILLRRAIQQRYDTHARAVGRTIAEEPGLHGGRPSADLVTDLVALRAYDVDERDAVNAALRTGSGTNRELLIARGALAGLRRLPAVFGPVFATGSTDPAGLRPGDELIEPGFLDADPVRAIADDTCVEYVIWSVGAHRLGGLCPERPTAVLFGPGSRFVVLAIDRPTGDGTPVRVLLRDSTVARAGRPELDERLTARLRATLDRPAARESRQPLPFAPGLDADGNPFTATALTAPTAEHGGL